MKILVTQEHIDKGTRHSICYCPIALALSEYNIEASVTGREIRIKPKNHKWAKWIALPISAQRFVYRFDKGKPVKPFNFIVPKLEEIV